ELFVRTVGDVDGGELRAAFRLDERRHAPPVGGEHRIGFGVVGQVAELAGPAVADPLHPEALVAPQEQRVAIRADVFDVCRAGTRDLRALALAVAAHRVDVGEAARPFAVVAAAVGDPTGEVARPPLVDQGGPGQPPQTGAGGPHRVEVVRRAA